MWKSSLMIASTQLWIYPTDEQDSPRLDIEFENFLSGDVERRGGPFVGG
jgi:hypothetical protein